MKAKEINAQLINQISKDNKEILRLSVRTRSRSRSKSNKPKVVNIENINNKEKRVEYITD